MLADSEYILFLISLLLILLFGPLAVAAATAAVWIACCVCTNAHTTAQPIGNMKTNHQHTCTFGFLVFFASLSIHSFRVVVVSGFSCSFIRFLMLFITATTTEKYVIFFWWYNTQPNDVSFTLSIIILRILCVFFFVYSTRRHHHHHISCNRIRVSRMYLYFCCLFDILYFYPKAYQPHNSGLYSYTYIYSESKAKQSRHKKNITMFMRRRKNENQRENYECVGFIFSRLSVSCRVERDSKHLYWYKSSRIESKLNE